ncbi:MAG: pitrilysin family protein [Chloroflexi bacterium]|nr:pitrilysin family protein [Chloroflexota bacterium]
MTSGARHAINADSVARHLLANGATLLVYPNPASPSVAIGAYHAAGAVLETREHAGLASLTADALNRGTANRTFLEFSEELDQVGASLAFHADTEYAALGGRALAEDLDLLLTLATDVLEQPTFPDDEVGRVREQTLTVLAHADDNPGSRAARRFRELLYGGSNPNGWPEDGYAETVCEFQADDLRAFHARAYSPASLVLAVVGAVDPPAVRDLVERTIGAWHASPDAATAADWRTALDVADAPPAALAEPRREDLTIEGKTQTEFLLGWLGIRRTDPSYHATIVANFILGQLGLGGRIGSNVRDTQGLAYHASSYAVPGLTRQPWSIRAGINPANVDRAIEASLHEARQLAEAPPDAEELQLSKQALIGSLPLRLERNDGIANMLLTMERYGLGLDHLGAYPGLIDSVSADDVREVTAAVMSDPAYTLVTAGPQLPNG